MIVITFDHKKDFSKTSRFLLTFFPRAKRRLAAIALEVMEKTEADLKRAIVDKDRSSFIKRLRRINPDWVKEKLSKGNKPHQLASTTKYAEAIHIVKGKDELTLTLRKEMYPGRKFTYGDLARFLEYGTVNMAPLPHWKKAAKYFRETLKERIREEFRNVRFSS